MIKKIGSYLMDLEESEEVGQRVNDHGPQLDGHECGHAGEELLHHLSGVALTRGHQVLPALLVFDEQLGACWDPAEHKCTQSHTQTYTHKCTQSHTHTCKCTHVHTHTHIHTHTHTHTHTNTHTHTHKHTQTHIQTHTHMDTHTHAMCLL